ncbi:MAG: hypothetical protein AAF225_05870 [Pseudomonadota bacterium]
MTKALLISAAAGALFVSLGSAFAQSTEAYDVAPRSIVVNRWSVETAYNYTDNYARFDDGLYERRFLDANGTVQTSLTDVTLDDGSVVQSLLPLNDTVQIDPVSNHFMSMTLSGQSIIKRKRIEAIVRGSATVGTYFQDVGVDDRYGDQANADLPDFAITDDLTGTIGDRNFDQTFYDPNLSAFAAYELVDDRFFLEAGGFMQEQSIFAGNELAAAAPGQDTNEAVLFGVFASPVYLMRFDQGQEIELRYRNSSIIVLEETIDAELIQGQTAVNDSVSNEVLAAYTTGNVFGGLEFRVAGFARRFEEDDSDVFASQTLEQASGSLGIYWQILRNLTLDGEVGYDEIDNEFEDPQGTDVEADSLGEADGDEISGTYYRVGFSYNPNLRLALTAGVGERYNGTQIDGSIDYEVTPRLRLSGEVARVLSSSLQDQQNNNLFRNSQSLTFIERAASTSSELSPNELASRVNFAVSDLQSVTFAGGNGRPSTRVQIGLVGQYGRNSFTLQGQARRDDDVEDDGLNRGNDQTRVSASFRRRLNRRLTLTAAADHVITERGFFTTVGNPSDLESRETSGQLTFDYTLSRTLAVTGTYRYLRRDNDPDQDVSSLFNGTLLEFQENSVSFGARWSF